MAMDESHDINQRSKKVKSKKHKKHKKSKKSAITLDEFLNMNQDVFGEGLDFQGVEEVPTKVIKRQLIPRKSLTQKSEAKLASSADLKKLQNAGIVVKVKPGSRPPPLKIRHVGQPVKVNPQAKNPANQTQTKTISASNEVLSKLMNQSSNQLKIVKKTIQEKTNEDNPAVNETVLEEDKNQPSSEDLAKPNSVEIDGDLESRVEKTDITYSNPNVLMDKNNDGKDLDDCTGNQLRSRCTSSESEGTDNLQEMDENNSKINNDMTNSDSKALGGNSAVISGNDFKDALKNISRQITIKSINSPATKPHVQSDGDMPFWQKEEQISDFENEISYNSNLNIDKIQSKPINKTLGPLSNINRAIKIKSQKNGNILIDDKNKAGQEKVEPNITQKSLNAPEKVPLQKNPPKNEKANVTDINKVQNDKIKETASSLVFKKMDKKVTVTSKSQSILQLKDEYTNKELDDSTFDEYDENLTEGKHFQKPVGTNLDIHGKSPSSNVLKKFGNNITIKSMTSPAKHLNEENESKEQDSSKLDEYDQNPMESKNVPNIGPSNVLKNLGKNITVKSTSPSIKQSEDNTNNEQYDSDFDEYDETPTETKNIEKVISTNFSAQVGTSTHVLKNLSKHITVKSTSLYVKQPKDIDEQEAARKLDAYNESPVENKTIKKVDSMGLSMPRTVISRPKIAPEVKQKQISRLPSAVLHSEVKEENLSEQFTDEVENSNIQSRNLLKHLKNITAKPLSTPKRSQQITAMSRNTTVSNAKDNNHLWKSVHKNESTEDIETFNIDDSDSDDAGKPTYQIKNVPKKIEPCKNEVKPNAALNAIKNIGKHITVKSSNNQTNQTMKGAITERHDSDAFSDDEIDNDTIHHQSNSIFEDKPRKSLGNIPPTTYKATTQRDETFKQVFKNLGKHITINSKTTISQSVQHASLDLKQNAYTANNRDADPFSGRVKIRDVTEETFSDDDANNFENKGIVTHSSECSNSGDDYFPEDMDDYDEFASQPLAMNSVNHNLKSPSEGLLKNISKNITVKSLNERNIENIGKCSVTSLEKDKLLGQNRSSNKLTVRSINQNKPDTRNESATSRSQSNTHYKRIVEASTSNQSAKSIVPESSDIINNVNKEVKVKTFQSETVIEEVTTTVTKTIRRVNQVNQQVYNASETSVTPKINQQVNNPKLGSYNQQTKNFQGLSVRQTSPGMVSPKIRQAIPLRPTTSTPNRPSNQPAPIRPNPNIRPNSSPRMQIKNMAQQQRSFGKPLKIAPNAMNQIIKRPAAEDTSGPFSCFKKPKESLIPGNDTAAGSSSDFHYTSSSQTSKFCSTAKIAKDNAVVTKTQMRSQSITQQQQMGRHGNLSGLKIAQCKQVSQVERSEANSSKRSALEAIEKLQKQGLLIKKPKVVEHDFDPRNSDDEYDEEFQDDE